MSEVDAPPDENALEFVGVGKMYKMFHSRGDNFLDALGLAKLRPWRKVEYREFWALRSIEFNLRTGQRIGIIGRNGAGKTTLLKLVTGNLTPTEGSVRVNGSVQALLEAGGGLHPEFTGYENIRATLTYQGLSSARLAAAQRDIAEFTELEDFLDQPFKTYSLGMQARLAFAIATTVEPDILIVDEMLGAGDAYFFSKSMGRMKNLVESGASVLIVSHALDQIARFCDETIWLERGQIVAHGPTIDVIRDYERFMYSLENRRLRGKSARMLAERSRTVDQDLFGERLVVQITAPAGGVGSIDVRGLTLRREDEVEDTLLVGSAQDADTSQSAFVDLELGGWSPPRGSGDESHRSVSEIPQGGHSGTVVFYLWTVITSDEYALEIRYRSNLEGAALKIVRAGQIVAERGLPATDDAWAVEELRVAGAELAADDRGEIADGEQPQPGSGVSRWPGEGKLRIAGVALLDTAGQEQAVFRVGSPLRVRVTIEAAEDGSFPVILAALIFRTDGVVVSRHVAGGATLDLRRGDTATAELDLTSLSLGNGYYALSIGLYRRLDVNDLEPSRFYDYVDKSYEFQVVGAPKMHNELVIHSGIWRVLSSGQILGQELAPMWVAPLGDTGSAPSRAEIAE